MINKSEFKVAYLSMEIALESDIKTYSGGLGVLAGDILKSAAKQNLPIIGMTMLSRHGYFDQIINQHGEQEVAETVNYNFDKIKRIEEKVQIKIEQDDLVVGAWVYYLKQHNGKKSPIYLLDTDFPENKKEYRHLTDHLYGSDKKYRLLQEIILGRASYLLLKKLGYQLEKLHLNEGHASFVTIAKYLDIENKTEAEKIKTVKDTCVFTTHSPIKEVNDIFDIKDVIKYQPDFPQIKDISKGKSKVNMNELGMSLSGYINSVAKEHRKTSLKIYSPHPIRNITNGVNLEEWLSDEKRALYDKYISNWDRDNKKLKLAKKIPYQEIDRAHKKDKKKLINFINKREKVSFKENIFTIGFARRFTAYKQPDLILRDLDSLIKVQERVGKIQIIYAGKAHPNDDIGKKLIAKVNQKIRENQSKISLVFLAGYDMDMAKLLIPGVDLWLNNPIPPNEASGTSGMKAAANGVPQLSTYDGWWCEGYRKNKTGWLIGNKKNRFKQNDNKELLKRLEKDIIPTYYQQPAKWLKMSRDTIAYNASYFNTERVVKEYWQKAYKFKLNS